MRSANLSQRVRIAVRRLDFHCRRSQGGRSAARLNWNRRRYQDFHRRRSQRGRIAARLNWNRRRYQIGTDMSHVFLSFFLAIATFGVSAIVFVLVTQTVLLYIVPVLEYFRQRLLLWFRTNTLTLIWRKIVFFGLWNEPIPKRKYNGKYWSDIREDVEPIRQEVKGITRICRRLWNNSSYRHPDFRHIQMKWCFPRSLRLLLVNLIRASVGVFIMPGHKVALACSSQIVRLARCIMAIVGFCCERGHCYRIKQQVFERPARLDFQGGEVGRLHRPRRVPQT